MSDHSNLDPRRRRRHRPHPDRSRVQDPTAQVLTGSAVPPSPWMAPGWWPPCRPKHPRRAPLRT